MPDEKEEIEQRMAALAREGERCREIHAARKSPTNYLRCASVLIGW
jgi:hypothetical protein